MSAINYYIIDTETNGLKSSYHEINEIGIIRVNDRVQVWKNIRCESPERSNADALSITKKTLADLERGDAKEDAVAAVDRFFAEDGLTPSHRCIVCHNVSFDRRFLQALWSSCGKTFPANLWLCTMALSKEYAKSQGIIKPKVNLHAACDLVGVKKIAQAHNAKVDSRNTYFLFKDLMDVKKVNYLPFIKTDIHTSKVEAEEEIDMSIFDE